MSNDFEVYISTTKAWHPCDLVDKVNMTVKLKAICKYDEENENEATYDYLEFNAEKKNLRPKGEMYGTEPSLEQDKDIEVWGSISGAYGWYPAKVIKIKKNVVHITSDVTDLESMFSKKATRLPNTKKAAFEEQSINIEVPSYLRDWIKGEDGVKLCQRCKDRKELQDLFVDDEGEYISLIGPKENLNSAVNFLKFNFDNLQFVDKLKGVKLELNTKLTKALSALNNQHKVEFSVPSEIVGMLVGSNYKKVKQMQEKYKCTIKITDDEPEQVKITIIGTEQATVELLERKLHILRREYSMDKRLVSFLIGQKGDRIKTIIENSQLIKIDFDNGVSNSGERVCLL
mmetsp:Transcript_65591/g.55682  ORF Transcript_65591/g.55682 Transcript_65591/m.55682 type:complete len:344 (-) Transcript_65591:554-1585(-)